MKRIFVSYSRTDVDFARRLATALSGAGADVWIDVEDIPIGMKWSSAIQEGLDAADAMLVVISPASMESPNVEDEWQYFMDQGKPVIPVWWKPAKMHFQLHRMQYIDFHTHSFEQAFAMLLGEMNLRGVALDDAGTTPAPVAHSASVSAAAPAQPKLPERPARSRLPLAIVGIVALLIVGVVALLALNPGSGEVSADVAEFLAEPLPAVQAVAAQPFPVHEDVSGTSPTERSFTEALIPVSFYDDATEAFWYQLEPPDGDIAFQIADFLVDSGAVSDVLLTMVPIVFEIETDEGYVSLYAEPDDEATWIDVQVEETVVIHGYRVDEEYTIWWLVDAFASEGSERLRGWLVGSDFILGALPVVTTLRETIPAYSDNPILEPEQASFTELGAETDVRVLYYETGGSADAALITAYRPIPGAWEPFWVYGLDLGLNVPTIETLEDLPTYQP